MDTTYTICWFEFVLNKRFMCSVYFTFVLQYVSFENKTSASWKTSMNLNKIQTESQQAGHVRVSSDQW